jgi:hypothetical protein
MYGLGDAMREMQIEIDELTRKSEEDDIYIVSLEYILTDLLDWYWNIEEPGYVPNSPEIREILRRTNKIIKKKRRGKSGLRR